MTPEQLEYQRQWRAENPEKVLASVKRWQGKNKDHLRDYARKRRQNLSPEKREQLLAAQRRSSMKRRYGATQEQYDSVLSSQGGHCALCPRTPDQERFKRLNWDHCHRSNELRGLLCTPCNHALGVLGDDVEGLRKALAYVSL